MKNQDAIDYFKAYIKFAKRNGMGIPSADPYKIAIKGLEELEQYRSIGTLDECREARKKQYESNSKISGKQVVDC